MPMTESTILLFSCAIWLERTYKSWWMNDTGLCVMHRQHDVCVCNCRIFLIELGGNPKKKNARSETLLHCILSIDSSALNEDNLLKLRLECLDFLLNWKGLASSSGSNLQDSLDVNATDCVSIFPQRSVSRFVSLFAPLFVVNKISSSRSYKRFGKKFLFVQGGIDPI